GTEFASFATSNANATTSGTTLYVNHNDFVEGAIYYITIDPGFIVSQATSVPFQGISDVNQWRFTAVISAPVSTITPTNGATQVNITDPIIVDFDLPVQKLDGTELNDSNLADIITFTQGGLSVPYSAKINTNKDQIIITPNDNLLSFTSYTIDIAAIESITGNIEQVTSTVSNFTTDRFRYWTGAISTDITDDGNWNSALPLGNFSAIIQQSASLMPTIDIDATFNSVIIEEGASLEITSIGSLTVNNLLELNSSNNQTVGNGILFNNGTLNTSSAEVKIHQTISSEPFDYYISSPVTSATPENVGVNGQSFKFVPNTKWVQMGVTDPYNPGEGYVVWSTSGTELIFSGTVNTNESYIFNCYRETSPYNNYGWNLLGNPYPCAIDLNSLDISDNMNYHFQFRLNDTGLLGIINESGDVNLNSDYPTILPSMHAVWVQVNEAQTQGSVIIPKSAQRSYNYTYLKSSKTQVPSLKLAGVNKDGIKDETLIAFNPNATIGSGNYISDKKFMDYNQSILELYSLLNDKPIAINTIPEQLKNQSIDLGYYAPSAGTYSIDIVKFNNIENAEIVLEDKVNSSETVLLSGDTYSFFTEKGTYENRFVIHFNNTATSISQSNDEQINIYNDHKNIYIELPDLIDPSLEIYDPTGKIILNNTLYSNTTNKITVSNSGLIIVKIISKEKVFSQKLLIK
uniref:Ig-like domain-containing protein n=1 Tax=Carboxylicivirga caseinilyticus TaxID=3417572 RepID=UPI003D3373E4|nr:Ig-like domain-containing protein [Marinilabiliaceae bacterium A049]